MKKYKKSSELLGKKIVLYSVFMAGTISATAFTLTACYKEKPEKLEYIEENKKECVFEDNNITNENYIYTESNLDQARKMISKINYNYNNIENEDLKQEIIDDNISIYLNALNVVNNDNPLRDFNINDYAINKYSELHGENRYSDNILYFNALAYKRLLDNNINISDALVELNTLMSLQINPTDIEEDEFNILFNNLLSTLNNGESVYEIYSPLAYDIHLISCDQIHTFSDYNITCDNLEKNYKVLTK